MDDTTTLPGGEKVTKKDFLAVWAKINSEITVANKLKPIHFNCVNMDRQKVSYAAQLLSNTFAHLMKTLFPNDRAKLALAEFIEVADKAFNLLTSTKLKDSDVSKCALGGEFLAQQLEILEKMIYYLKNMKYSGKPRFNNGMIMAIRANIEVQRVLARDYGLQQLMTQKTNQEN